MNIIKNQRCRHKIMVKFQKSKVFPFQSEPDI